MKEKEKILIYSYRLSMQNQLESELIALRQNVRFRNIDVNDCLELCLAIERLNMFNQVMKDITMLLGLYKSDKENEV